MSNKKYNVGYPIYETSYGTDLPFEQYYLLKYDTLPSKLSLSGTLFDLSIIDMIKSEMGFKEEIKISSENKRCEKNNETLLSLDEKNIFIKIYSGRSSLLNNFCSLDILYSIDDGSLDSQLEISKFENYKRTKKRSNIQLVKSEMGHLDTEDYDLDIQKMDLELNYGSGFLRVHNTIVEKLNTNRGKGIILLHGDPGTGKTSYIKYLTSLITEKDILFIPPSMAEMLSEPSIIPFLMDHKNSILIIEDAERVIADREGKGSPAGVSNILNLTDGILGDCLSIQILATFNMKREKIDPALLRKGRLIAEHKFEKLSIENSNKLLESLQKEHTVSESTSLADLYHIDVEEFKTSDNKSKIGLK